MIVIVRVEMELPTLTQREVAEFYKRFREPISAARVFQIERKALAKLRKALSAEKD